MGEHQHGTDPGPAADRPAFDEVAHGYDPRQVDDYLATLWRYASRVTSRAAAAESALKHERERNDARAADDQIAAQAGGRIGQMLAIAEQQAEEIVEGARRIAESALEEVIEDAGANHPIVREARGQAEKLLLDAVEESHRLARQHHRQLAEDLARSSASLDTLRHQQGEIIGAVLRLRGILGSDELDRAVTDLARAGAAPRPDDPADANGSAEGARRSASAAQGPADGVRNGSTPPAHGTYPGGVGSDGAGSGGAGSGGAGSDGPDSGVTGLGDGAFGDRGFGGPGSGGAATGGLGEPGHGAAGDPTASWRPGGSGEPYPGDGAAHRSFWAGAGESAGGSRWTAGAAAAGVGAAGFGGGGWAEGATATVGGVPGRGPEAAGFGRRPGRHRQADPAGADEAPASTSGVPFRRGADEEIVDAEIVEE
ncbi:DivIVA domain-containing protein [Frankia sp. AgB32]|uniref:DivIVA domain-containing protein n=1 Tax=Frankia sp. AgB32 TaxID=631119 RepID=UPI0024B0444F|nr:hypothetical protein [Frankia sp. AgB32]